MPFLAAGALIGGLGAGTVAGGMTALGGAALGASLGSMVQGQVDARSAAKKAQAAADNAKIDIQALDEQTRAIAKQNALDAAELERQMTPEVPQLRSAANNAVLNAIGGTPEQKNALAMIFSRINQPGTTAQYGETPLLREAIAKARSDLALGGKLSLDQQNAATRRGAATAATVGGGNLGLGRDLAARDLGRTAYDVENQRLSNAATIGALESQDASSRAGFGLSRDSLGNQNFLSNFSLLSTFLNNMRQQDLSAAAFGQSIAPPTVGLDPSAVANLAVGNQNVATQGALNAANIKAQGAQNLMGFGGQLLGYGMMNGFGGGGGGLDSASSYMNWGRN